MELYIVRQKKQRLGSAENLNLFNLKFTNSTVNELVQVCLITTKTKRDFKANGMRN